MARCSAKTKNGMQCKKKATKGEMYCHVHNLSKQQKKRIIRLSTAFSMCVAIIAIIANFAQIGQWIGLKPPSLKQPRSPVQVIEDLLSVSETLAFSTDNSRHLIQIYSEKCRQRTTYIENYKCWLELGALYSVDHMKHKALDCYSIAHDINPQIADAYYAKGDLYFDLAVLDLLRKRRFKIDSDQLSCMLMPDDDSKAVFTKALDEYNIAEHYPTLKDVEPSDNLNWTLLHICSFRKQQMMDFLEGSTTIQLHKADLIDLIRFFPFFSQDQELMESIIRLSENLLKFQEQHPEEFPHLLPNGFYDKLRENPNAVEKYLQEHPDGSFPPPEFWDKENKKQQ